jgi:hypothetical protein
MSWRRVARGDMAMTDKLPKPIDAYFAAKNTNDVDGMVASFSDEATVKDEGKTIRGPAAIREWIDGTNAKYRYTVEVTGVRETAAGANVACTLTGSFPGSPVDVEYAFGLTDGKITTLAIN